MANNSMREEIVEALQYWCSRARHSSPRPWYFRALVWACGRLEK
jgi:hypothetical protein